MARRISITSKMQKNKILKILLKIWNWYYSRFVFRSNTNVPLEKLKWLPKKLTIRKRHQFGCVDSIRFDISKLPVKQEIIFDMISKKQALEVIENVQSAPELLNKQS